MIWEKCKKGHLPKTEVLCVDNNQQYLVGRIFEAEDSSTGFMAVGDFEQEIQCIAYYNCADVKWNDPTVLLPDESTEVLCHNLTGHILVGKLTPNDWGFQAENQDEISFMIDGWIPVPKYVIADITKHKKFHLRNFLRVTSLFLIGFMSASLVDMASSGDIASASYLEPMLHYSNETIYDQVFNSEIDLTATQEVLENEYNKSCPLIGISVGQQSFSEIFNSEHFYVDMNGGWHYVDSHDHHIVIGDDGVYITKADVDNKHYAYEQHGSLKFEISGAPTSYDEYETMSIVAGDEIYSETFQHYLPWFGMEGSFAYYGDRSTYIIANNILTIYDSANSSVNKYDSFEVYLNGPNNIITLYNTTDKM